MKTAEKAIQLLYQKYRLPIVVLGDNKNNKLKSVLNTDDGTLFSIADSQYTFRDQDGNFWLTIPKKLIINEKRYYPVPGDSYAFNGMSYFFREPKDVIAMATDYFESFIDTDYGLEKEISWHLFFDKHEHYVVPYTCFKSEKHTKMEAYISNN